jgi:hypothetical protein
VSLQFAPRKKRDPNATGHTNDDAGSDNGEKDGMDFMHRMEAQSRSHRTEMEHRLVLV